MPNIDTVLSLVEQDMSERKFSRAMARLVGISVQCSHDLRFLSLLAQTQKSLGDLPGHIKTLAAIAKLNGSHAAHLDHMAALYAEGRLNESLDVGLFLQEQTLNEINAKYFTRMMVRIYLEFCDYEGVIEVVHKYSELQPPDDLMHWALGFVSLAEGNRDAALNHFRKSVELNTQNDQAWISLAMLHDEVGDRELALANLEKALDINPKNSTGLKLLAKWHQKDLASVNNAIGRLSHYLAEHSFDEEISLCYVQLLKENESLQLAEFELEKLILNNPKSEAVLKMKNTFQDAVIS